MHFKYNVFLAGLLALSQTLWTTQAIPVTSLQVVNNTVVIRGSEISEVENVHEYHVKRNDPDLDMGEYLDTNEDRLLKTWSGWYDEPNNSEWNYDTIAQFAILAHRYISREHKEPWILAALWIRGEGVAFGTQVRGLDFTDRKADDMFETLLPNQAPVLWHYVQHRTKVGSNTDPKWHAEDVAMWKAAKEMRRLGKPIITAKYPLNSVTEFVPPCKTRTPQNNNKLTPGCEEVLAKIGIKYYDPVGWFRPSST
jgi:hypothetical protein